MRTIINRLDADFTNAKNKCRTTVGKDYTSSIPSGLFNLKLLISEHSPIRVLTVDWSWKDIPSWVATHWSRHKWECFIESQRSDRTGIDREKLPQDSPVNFDGVANAQNLIDTMRKRLCYKSSKETRELAEDLKETLYLSCAELAEVLVPNCVYRCGCPEFESCGFFGNEIFDEVDFSITDIKTRYQIYNDWFVDNRR